MVSPVLLSSVLLLVIQRVNAGPVVTVLNGTYEGLHLDNYEQDVFLGMPYAQHPVGDRRFKAPESLNTSWQTPRSAVEYADICMQYTVRTSHVNNIN